jgi:lysylphosphatidylglycerol synthetase-like protein (DUF2156 family)
MLYLAQVNFGANVASLIGFAYILLSLVYLIFMIVWLASRARRLNSSSLVLYIIQVIFIPIILLLSGLILIFQGWRLDPILQFSQLLLTLLVFYLIVKNIFINAIYQNR